MIVKLKHREIWEKHTRAQTFCRPLAIYSGHDVRNFPLESREQKMSAANLTREWRASWLSKDLRVKSISRMIELYYSRFCFRASLLSDSLAFYFGLILNKSEIRGKPKLKYIRIWPNLQSLLFIISALPKIATVSCRDKIIKKTHFERGSEWGREWSLQNQRLRCQIDGKVSEAGWSNALCSPHRSVTGGSLIFY